MAPADTIPMNPSEPTPDYQILPSQSRTTRPSRGRPSTEESLARRTMREQAALSKRRAIMANARSISKKNAATFQRVYARWIANRSPEELASILTHADPSAVRADAKKELFLELYKQMWPDKVEALAACGASLGWLREQLKRDPEYAACILEVELRRLDTLKAFSYEQSFHPQNVNERLFWLKTIGRDEFGDEPLVNITNLVSNKAEGFDKLEALLKRRDELLRKREALLGPQQPTPAPSPEQPGGGTSQPQQ